MPSPSLCLQVRGTSTINVKYVPSGRWAVQPRLPPCAKESPAAWKTEGGLGLQLLCGLRPVSQVIWPQLQPPNNDKLSVCPGAG